ncbi:MAG TPA: hypothetical protein PLN69_06765 [bacterium]|nr:hypothetical protein [bacterium]
MNYPEDFSSYIDKIASFLHIYLGDVREAIAHTDKISKFGRVIYNEAAWDTEKFKEIKEDITCATHYDVIKEVLLRIEKYKCEKVDMGFVGGWKNPYQIADTHLPTGITVSVEKKESHFEIHIVFFSPQQWFSLQCKPLFRTDPIVEKEPKGSWNMNSVGLIAPKPEKTAANRRLIFNMFGDFVKNFQPEFAGVGLSNFFFNFGNDTAYLVSPEAKENDQLLPLIYFLKEDSGKLLFSDSSDLPSSSYNTTQVKDQRVFYETKHFDFLQ